MFEYFHEYALPQHLLLYIFAYALAATPTDFVLKKLPDRLQNRGGLWLSFDIDFLKGVFPCAIAQSLHAPVEVIALVLLFGVLGQAYSLWLRFAGTPAGATFLGGLLFIDWLAAVAGILIYYMVGTSIKSVGLAGMLAVFGAVAVAFFSFENNHAWWIVVVTAAVVSIDYRKGVIAYFRA
jgi:glycerol-3-phosphate acyltransferase PlsY